MRRFAAATLAVLFGLILTLYAFGQVRRRARAITMNPAQHKVADLRPVLRRKGLRQRAQVLHTSRGGLRISAKVRLVDWEVTDSDGNKLEITDSKTRNPRSGDTVCWKCAKDTSGTIHCWQVDCPILAPTR